MMKKIALIIAVAMLFTLVGCGGPRDGTVSVLEYEDLRYRFADAELERDALRYELDDLASKSRSLQQEYDQLTGRFDALEESNRALEAEHLWVSNEFGDAERRGFFFGKLEVIYSLQPEMIILMPEGPRVFELLGEAIEHYENGRLGHALSSIEEAELKLAEILASVLQPTLQPTPDNEGADEQAP